MPKAVVQIPIETLFNPEQRNEALFHLAEADVAEIVGDEVVLVNLNEVLFVDTYENVVIFHFKNRDTLSVTKNVKQKQKR